MDGAVTGGRLTVTLIRKKILTPLPRRQAVGYISVSRTQERLYEDVTAALSSMSEVLGYCDCIFHADVIVSGREVFLIETAPRPSGHYLHDHFVPLCCGVDMAEQYIRFLLGMPYRFMPKLVRHEMIHFFDFSRASPKRIPTREELEADEGCRLVDYSCSIRPGEELGEVKDGRSIMGRGYFIVEGASEADLMRQSSHVLSLFEAEEN